MVNNITKLQDWINAASVKHQRAFNIRMVNNEADMIVELYDSEKEAGINLTYVELETTDIDTSSKWAESYRQIITQAQSQLDYFTLLLNG